MSEFSRDKVPSRETKYDWNPVERSQTIWRGKREGSRIVKPEMGIEFWKRRKIIEYEIVMNQEKMHVNGNIKWWALRREAKKKKSGLKQTVKT